jgi:Oxygenase, catalysing oxidative methylation of damaged DNA
MHRLRARRPVDSVSVVDSRAATVVTQTDVVDARLRAIDWAGVGDDLDADGNARLEGLLVPVVVPLRQGDAAVIAVHTRPVRGTRGPYRVNLRHGVARVRTRHRHTLGIIFHDAT